MRLNVSGLVAFCLFAFQPAWLHAQDQIRDLVVKIHAIHHTPEGSNVSLRVDAQQPVVRYTVEDQGSGIEESEVERIFDIYVTKAAGDNRGAGLGLPLSRRLARLLGGELMAISRPRRGGCFILELPASTADEEIFTKASAGP